MMIEIFGLIMCYLINGSPFYKKNQNKGNWIILLIFFLLFNVYIIYIYHIINTNFDNYYQILTVLIIHSNF